MQQFLIRQSTPNGVQPKSFSSRSSFPKKSRNSFAIAKKPSLSASPSTIFVSHVCPSSKREKNPLPPPASPLPFSKPLNHLLLLLLSEPILPHTPLSSPLCSSALSGGREKFPFSLAVGKALLSSLSLALGCCERREENYRTFFLEGAGGTVSLMLLYAYSCTKVFFLREQNNQAVGITFL